MTKICQVFGLATSQHCPFLPTDLSVGLRPHFFFHPLSFAHCVMWILSGLLFSVQCRVNYSVEFALCLPRRVLGSLLSAHLIIRDPLQPFGRLTQTDYNDELLDLAHDLGTRLLAAFDNTATGIPHPRVSLLTADLLECFFFFLKEKRHQLVACTGAEAVSVQA